MSRRASSGINPGIIVGAVVVIGLVIFGGKLLLSDKSASFGDVAPLNIEELLQNGNSLRNNEYVVEGEIDEKLQFANTGMLVSVKVDGDEFIGIEIPSEFEYLNIEPKQKYAFRVKFKKGGIAVATGINRL